MGTYVYAVTAEDHPVRLEGLTGVGQPPEDVRILRESPLLAVVSDAPPELRAKRRDLVAHQAVLERLMEDGSVLPMRFGLVAPDEDSVKQVLDENAEAYTDRLHLLAGCVEYHLKASRDEDDLLREIVGTSPEVRELNEFTRAHPEAQDERMRLGETVSAEVRRREEQAAQEIVSTLAADAERHVTTEADREHFLNASFLVRRGSGDDFARAVREEGDRRGGAYSLSLYGPLPPYSFV
jgi:pimeloyl-ACP methyl ester carboxylesterase